jgi:hypothetical protein
MSETLELLQSREIKIYSTLAQNLRTITTTARTCGELMEDMDRAGIPYRGMSMVIGETAQGLVGSSSSLLPGEQTILLMPIEVKSGWDEEDDTEEYEDDDEGEVVLSPREEAIQHLRHAAHCINGAIACLEKDFSAPIVSGPIDPEIERLNRMASSIQQASASMKHIAANQNIFD